MEAMTTTSYLRDRESWFCIFVGPVVRRAGNSYFIDTRAMEDL